MASVKIGQLVIRTLAKPIATQLKSQAANHESFRKLCVNLAQFMHKTEITLRSNLIGGTHQKVRPLNDAKAVANGANAISEGFLFAVAAALIIGETYRGSRSRAKQRDSTESAVEELRVMVEGLAQRLEIPLEDLRPPPEEDESETISSEFSPEVESNGSIPVVRGGSPSRKAMGETEELERLRASVQVLLQLALRSGWIQGEEALRLDDILQGRDAKKEGEMETLKQSQPSTISQGNVSAEGILSSSSIPASSSQIQEGSSSSSSSPSQSSTSSTSDRPSPSSIQNGTRSEILAAIAQERVKTMISELIEGRRRGSGLEGEGGDDGWKASSSGLKRPTGDAGDEGEALGAASKLAEMLERAGAGAGNRSSDGE